MKEPELLAPAGSFDALIAAVLNGADAVYMGGSKFNARRFADNFTDELLEEAVKYAHLYGVRVYITLNTLIKEKELYELREYLELLDGLKVDGIILQDLGVAQIVSREFPNLALHASTQMTIHNIDGIRFLEKIGFKRAVLARELSLEEIDYISGNTDIELEIFVHGALCICYSGQCLMSSFIGGRSGNRGMCAQPCRLPYKIDLSENQNKKERYYLSPKDLCSITLMDKITKSSISSLKIEGRMKRPEYVAVVTNAYRNVLDKLKSGEAPDDYTAYEEDLMQIFNRGGFTKKYLKGDSHDKLISIQKPNNWGVYTGKVIKYEKGFAYIQLENVLENGDNIEFWIKNGPNKGQLVDNLMLNGEPTKKAEPGDTVMIRTKFPVDRGIVVYKTASESQLNKARSTFSDKYIRKIPIKAKGEFKSGLPARLILLEENGIIAEAVMENAVQPALKKPISYERVMSQLDRLGDTPYIFSDIKLDVDDNIFISLSDINQLRRDAVNILTARRIEYFEKKNPFPGYTSDTKSFQADDTKSLKADDIKFSLTSNIEFSQVGNTKSLQTSLDTPYEKDATVRLSGYVDKLDYPSEFYNGLDIINYDPLDWSFNAEDIKKLTLQAKTLKSLGFRVNLVLPRIARKEDMKVLTDILPPFHRVFDGFQAGNPGMINYLNQKGFKPVIGGYSLNIFNSAAVEVLNRFGIESLCLSPELTIGEIHDIIKKSILPCEILVFGRVPLMIMDYNPDAPSLYDRKGYEFKLRKRKVVRGYTEVMNSMPVFTILNINALQSVPGLTWGLYLQGMSADTVKKVISLYRFAALNPGVNMPPELSKAVEEIKNAGFTKGHLFRGVD